MTTLSAPTAAKALVTGASRGIGRAIALELSKTRELILCSRSHSFGASEQLLRPSERVQWLQCDLSCPQSISQRLLPTLQNTPIDTFVHAAGVSLDRLLVRTSLKDMQSLIQTNLLSAIQISQPIAKGMMVQRGGCIIFVSSVVGLTGNAGQSVYSASKAGLLGLTKSLAKELGPRGIRVNAIAPGLIETDMTAGEIKPTHNQGLSENLKKEYISRIPLGRFGTPHEVALAVKYLTEASYMTGQVLVLDGGMVNHL